MNNNTDNGAGRQGGVASVAPVKRDPLYRYCKVCGVEVARFIPVPGSTVHRFELLPASKGRAHGYKRFYACAEHGDQP